MTFDEVLDQVRELLQQRGRVTYRALKRRFDLDDEYLEDLKGELIKAERVATDEDGDVLVWTGASPVPSSKFQVPSQDSELRIPNPELSPVSYTPAHLAERIRAEQVALEARGAADGERKTITALFADLKGSTALIEGLDPEEARAIIDPALQLMMDAVHRYEGYVAQALERFAASTLAVRTAGPGRWPMSPRSPASSMPSPRTVSPTCTWALTGVPAPTVRLWAAW